MFDMYVCMRKTVCLLRGAAIPLSSKKENSELHSYQRCKLSSCSQINWSRKIYKSVVSEQVPKNSGVEEYLREKIIYTIHSWYLKTSEATRDERYHVHGSATRRSLGCWLGSGALSLKSKLQHHVPGTAAVQARSAQHNTMAGEIYTNNQN